MGVNGLGRALFAGRFQPFHLGHVMALEYALDHSRDVVLAVCAPSRNYTSRDPFTVGERLEMIWCSLSNEHRTRCLTSVLDDDLNNRLWAEKTISALPPVTVAFTNNAIQRELLRCTGLTVEPIPLTERQRFSATNVRHLLATRDPEWRALVPLGAVPVLERIDAETRLTRLHAIDAGDDTSWTGGR